MRLKMNSTDNYGLDLDVNVDYNIPEITVTVTFWDKKKHEIHGYEFPADEFYKALELYNELEAKIN